MRWLILLAFAMTLGVLFASWSAGGAPRQLRAGAPMFGGTAGDSAAEWEPGSTQRSRRPGQAAEGDDVACIVEERKHVEDADPAELARAGTWRKTFQHYAQWGWVEEQIPVATRHLREALQLAENPVARQNVIFLTARTLPREDARRVLLPLLETGSAGDIEDVVCALAFGGDYEMFQRFKDLAAAPAPTAVARLIDTLFEVELLEATANEEARGVLRSYRTYEVLAREEYFRLATDGRSVWFPYSASSPDGSNRRIELWRLWMARYPGHPGSDDVAIRIAELHPEDPLEAARWYDRAACLPDQRRTSKALRGLLLIAERELSRAQLEALLASDVRNPVLLNYVAIRRTAAEQSCAAGLSRLREFAERYPRNELAEAWRRRDAESPPGDPPGADRLGAIHDRIARDRSDYDRLQPHGEALQLCVAAMARQFGLWERVAELERELATAQGENAASKRLGLGDLTLAEPELFFPVYAQHTFDAGRFLRISGCRAESCWDPWMRATIHAIRAYDIFRALPESLRSDGVLRSREELNKFEPLDRRRPERPGE